MSCRKRLRGPRAAGLTLVEPPPGAAVLGVLCTLLPLSRSDPAIDQSGAPANPPAIVQSSSAKLELRVISASYPVQLDRKKEVRAVITNRGQAPATLVMPGDGSYSAWRTPIVAWSTQRADNRAVAHTPLSIRPRLRKCGNLDRLTQDQVFTLRPGESKVIAAAPLFPGPGRYRIVYFYRNIPNLKWHGSYTFDPGTMDRVRQSTPCSLVSNELIVTVVE